MCAFGPICRRLSLVLVVLVTAYGMFSRLPHTHCLAVDADERGEAVSAADHGHHSEAVCLACTLASTSSATLTETVAVGHGGWISAAGPAPVVARDLGLSPLLRARSPPSRLG